MNNTESRKAFEEWAVTEILKLPRDSDGFYMNITTHKAWEAWQASRAKPIVLPAPTVANYDVVIPYGDVKRAIEAAGYRCE